MMQATLYLITAVGIMMIGLFGVMIHRHLIRKLLALNLFAAGVFMAYIAIARRAGLPPDPVPHAMVLTGIVISVSSTAFGLQLARRIHMATGKPELPPRAE